jgi:tetratricopeptide (TPR) repeat protein
MPVRPRRAPHVARGSLLLGALLAAAACAGDTETALARGDRLWADSQYTEALAEYRLAAHQRGDDVGALARVAHAFARTGQFARTHEAYQDLLERAPEYADQALFDYVTLARQAGERGDRYGMASALEAALAIRPGLSVGELAAPLARFYSARGEPERALAFYERALSAAAPDSVPVLLYELAELHEGRGDCRAAMGYFRAYQERAPRAVQAEQAGRRIGGCAWTLAQEARTAGDTETALRYLDMVLDLGVPENLQDQAWFARGEILAGLGFRSAAGEAFNRVLELDRGRGGRLAEQAREWLDRLRFGRGRGR